MLVERGEREGGKGGDSGGVGVVLGSIRYLAVVIVLGTLQSS